MRLFYDYFIGETTTIGYDYSRSCYDYSSRNATTIADLYWLSGESPKKSCGESRQWFRADRRALAAGLPRWVEGARMTLSRLTVETLDPPGLHGLRYAAPSYIPYYNRASVLTCAASGRDGGIWYALEALQRCDTLQRGASGVIVDCIGLVSLAAEWEQSQETPL